MTDRYEAVVFDNDGVIVEPTEISVLVDAVVDSFRAFGVEIERSVAQETVDGDTVPVETVREHGLDPEAFWHGRELRASLAQQTHIREGEKPVYDDVTTLDRLDVPLGLVSNNQHATIEFLLAHHNLTYFETAYGRQPTLAGAAKRKPEPDYIQRALTDLRTEEALYVGDSPKDIVAAHRAGIDSAFLRRDHVADIELSTEPTFEVPSLRALVDRLTAVGQDHRP